MTEDHRGNSVLWQNRCWWNNCFKMYFFLLWILFLACNCIKLFIKFCKVMCLYAQDHFNIKHVICVFQSSINTVFFRVCVCQISCSQRNAEEVYRAALADSAVLLQNYSLCIPGSPGNSRNGRFVRIVLETVLNLQAVWLQAKHISRHLSAAEWARLAIPVPSSA